MMFHEIASSNLVKVDFQGNVVDSQGWSVNPAGFVIHSAILSARTESSLRGINASARCGGFGTDAVEALMRLLERDDPSYRA